MNNEIILEGYIPRFNSEIKREPFKVNIESLAIGGNISYIPTQNIIPEYKQEETSINPFSRDYYIYRNRPSTQSISSTSIVHNHYNNSEQNSKEGTKESTFEEPWNDIDEITLFEEDPSDDYKNRYTNGRWESLGNYAIFIPEGNEYTPEEIQNVLVGLTNGATWSGARGTFKNGKFEKLEPIWDRPITSNSLQIDVEAGQITPAKDNVILENNVVLKGAAEELVNMFRKAGLNIRITSGFREGAVTNSGRISRHSKAEAIDVTPINGQSFAELKEAFRNNTELLNYMIDNGWGIVDETVPEVMKRTGATGPHWHIGKDTTATPAEKFFNYIRASVAKRGIKLPSLSEIQKILNHVK